MSRTFILDYTWIVLSLKEYTVGQEHLNEVIRQDEAEIPVEERHELAFCLDHVSICWHHVLLSELSTKPVVIPLHIIDENQLVVNLIVFRGDQEAGREEDR